MKKLNLLLLFITLLLSVISTYLLIRLDITEKCMSHLLWQYHSMFPAKCFVMSEVKELEFLENNSVKSTIIIPMPGPRLLQVQLYKGNY